MKTEKKKSKPDKIEVVETRQSVIRKSIQRTLSTAKFESIVISDSIEEVVEWTDLEDRDKKIKNWETVLLQQFKESHDRILGELNISHKKAYFVNHLEDKDNRPDVEDKLQSDFLDELDTLD